MKMELDENGVGFEECLIFGIVFGLNSMECRSSFSQTLGVGKGARPRFKSRAGHGHDAMSSQRYHGRLPNVAISSGSLGGP